MTPQKKDSFGDAHTMPNGEQRLVCSITDNRRHILTIMVKKHNKNTESFSDVSERNTKKM